jgi:sugar O-acyltransferase (sialic acid O-acetyltransferase NeuD family)
MNKVIVFGAGRMAEIAHVYIEHDTKYEVTAFSVDRQFYQDTSFRGLPIAPFENLQHIYPPSEYKMFIPLAAKDNNKLREKKYLEAKAMGYSFISYISSKAIVCPEVSIGENCFILEGNVIQPFVTIGNNVVLWSGNHIGHHGLINDHVYLASHVVVSGHVTIGSYSYLGVNSTIRDGIEILPNSVIGAGALVMRETEGGGVYMGLPCKKISLNAADVELP